MEISKLYEEISKKGIEKINNNEEYIDKLIDNQNDTRMGLTLLITPSEEIKNKIEIIQNELKMVEEDQYYYKKDDLHVTLLDITTARQDFKYTKEQLNNCLKIATQAIKNIKPFEINFKGIIASDGAILVKGFYENQMEILRRNIRKEIINNNMKLDERYPTISSHITISRFRKKIEKRKELIKKVQEYNDYDFGKMKVSNIELVYHNWYNSKKEIIKNYMINENSAEE